MKNYVQIMLRSWCVITLFILMSIAVIYHRLGMKGFEIFIQQWPLSNLNIMLASTALTWLCLGALFYLLAYEKIKINNVLTFAGFFLVMFVYLNILRERFRYGDYHYYLEAATNLLQNKPLPDTYIYLPLWATLVQFIAPFGDEGVLLVLWNLNIIFLIGFYFLLHRLLEIYGFSVPLAALTTTFFILVNTPLHRTLGYVQVNLLAMVLILLGILFYPRWIFLSALTLALAVHLKTSPVVLVLAFLLERNWRWLIWFLLSFLVIGLIPVAINGTSPYYDFLTNIALLSQNNNTIFHDTSFDSFLRFLDPFLRINVFWTRVLIYVSKLLLGIATIFVMMRNVRRQIFIRGQDNGTILLNAIPPLFILMTLASPIVWDHHGIFVTVPFLVVLKWIDSPAKWALYSFAYFLEFVLPSFDFFPWSFGRLLAPLIVLGLMWGIEKQGEQSRFFALVSDWLSNLSTVKA